MDTGIDWDTKADRASDLRMNTGNMDMRNDGVEQAFDLGFDRKNEFKNEANGRGCEVREVE